MQKYIRGFIKKAIASDVQERRALEIQCDALIADSTVLRRLLFAAAELLDSAVAHIDAIFPNDAQPQMQEDLHGIADRLRTLSDSKVGSLTGPDGVLAAAAREERLSKERVQAPVLRW